MNRVTAFMASVINDAIRDGELARLVEVWVVGSSGGLTGGFIRDDGTSEIMVESTQTLTAPLQIFCFDQDGKVKQFVFENCRWEEGLYERAC